MILKSLEVPLLLDEDVPVELVFALEVWVECDPPRKNPAEAAPTARTTIRTSRSVELRFVLQSGQAAKVKLLRRPDRLRGATGPDLLPSRGESKRFASLRMIASLARFK
jgi:hypothetical protein